MLECLPRGGCSRRSVSSLAVEDVPERPRRPDSGEGCRRRGRPGRSFSSSAVLMLCGVTRTFGRSQRGLAAGKGLAGEDVERRASEMARSEGLDQRGLVHELAAPDVDQDGAGLHRGELGLAQEARRLGGERDDQGDVVALLEERPEAGRRIDRVDVGRSGGIAGRPPDGHDRGAPRAGPGARSRGPHGRSPRCRASCRAACRGRTAPSGGAAGRRGRAACASRSRASRTGRTRRAALAWSPAALVTTIGRSPSPMCSTTGPRRSSRAGSSGAGAPGGRGLARVARSTSNMTSASATSAAHSAAWSGVRVTGAV